MALAFVIIAHKNAAQVARLFRAIHRREDVIVLHFDRRSDSSLHRLGHELARKHPNVILLRPRAVLWGGFTAAEVQLAAMEAALAADSPWHHFINLSGQDFPLRGLEQLEARLVAEPQANYIPWFDPLESPLWGNARERIERYYFDCAWLDRILRLPGIGRRVRKMFGWQNQFPFLPGFKRMHPDFRYYGGSNYVVLSREACDYVGSDPKARRISDWLRHAVHPDEIFIQTILLNSPLAHTVVNANLHEIDFAQDSPHPRTYTMGDLNRLIDSKKFFARKLDGLRDPALLETLAERLH